MLPQAFSATSASSASTSTRIERLGAGRPDEHAARARRARALTRSTASRDGRGQLLRRDADVLLACAKRGITAAASLERAAAQRRAEQQRGGEAVAGDVVAQVDHVARLLAAEDAALAPSASST